MTKTLRIVLAQLNLCVGDLANNLKKHIEAAIKARDEHEADVIVFPELSLTGYSPEDLLYRDDFITECKNALEEFIQQVQGIYCLITAPYLKNEKLYNAAFLIYNGKIIAQYAKHQLPNKTVFDECRYFTPGRKTCIAHIKNIPIAIIICEDIWRISPARTAAQHGAKLLLVPNASPFETDKHERRKRLLAQRARKNKLTIVYVNTVGGQDEIIFDGGSMVVDHKGQIAQCAGFFNEELYAVDIHISTKLEVTQVAYVEPSQDEKIYSALTLGLRDYIEKNNFPGVIVGASGGIDSALTLALAVEALGPKRVQAVIMPSRYSADISMEDALQLVKNLKIKHRIISIEPMYQQFLDGLSEAFAGKEFNHTEENIQARCRGILLMALSNQTGNLVVTTGNRSEYAVGYCTLYGDMAGGFALLKDVFKTEVYALARYINRQQEIIPQRTIDRPPSAELAPNQKDEDSLPPYSVLDEILKCYMNNYQTIDEIVAQGFERETVQKIVSLLHKNEYKRRQSAIGPRINFQAFGKDWRFPITNRYKK